MTIKFSDTALAAVRELLTKQTDNKMIRLDILGVG